MTNKIVQADGTVYDHSKLTGLTLTRAVNNDTDITIGSACTDCLEFTLWGGGGIGKGSLLTLYKVAPNGTETKAGVFVAEKPKQVSDNTYKVTAYDKMSLTEASCTGWLANTMFPNGTESYTLVTFIRATCAAIGLPLGDTEALYNQSYPVSAFSVKSCTYRQLIKWAAELGGCYAHMDADGRLCFCWYAASNVIVTPYVTASSLGARMQSHDDFSVKPIDAVRITLADSEIVAGSGTNVYDISDNPYFEGGTGVEVQSAAETILTRLKAMTYTPAELEVSETLAVACGDIVTMVDKALNQYTVPVMNMTVTGGGVMTITATGNARRDSATAVSTAYQKSYTKAEAQRTIVRQVVAAKKELQDQIGGVTGGCRKEHYNEFGQCYEVLYIDTLDEETARNVLRINNAGIAFSKTGVSGEYTQALSIDGGLANEWISTWRLTADIIVAGILQSADETTFYLDLTKGILRMNANSLSIKGKAVATEGYADTAAKDAASKAASEAVENQTQESIFNKLTENGTVQGIYLEKGKIYINLEYAKAGKIAAERIDVTNLFITRLLSKSGSISSYVEMLDNGLNFVLGGSNSIGIGYYNSGVPQPYLIFGAGVSPTSDTAGMIKMYQNGIWIGNSADRNSGGIYKGTGLFVDTVNNTIYKYVSGASSIIADDTNVIAAFG